MEHITDLYKSGINFFKTGNYEKAAENFVKILDFDNTNAKAWNALGLCLFRMEEYKQARTCFLNAVKFSPDNKSYLKNLRVSTKKLEKKAPPEPNVSILRLIPRKLSEFNVGITEYACLLIGFVLLCIAYLLPAVGIKIPSPTGEIIGISGIIFIIFFVITTLMKYLQFLGVKRIHFLITLAALLILAFPVYHLLHIPVTNQFIPANLKEFQERTYQPLITPTDTGVFDPGKILYSADKEKRETTNGSPVILVDHCTKPQAAFEYEIVRMDPFIVRFIDTSDTLLSPTRASWDFGDETYSTEKSPIHEYNRLGSYPVNLTIYNECGGFDSVIRTIHPVYANITPQIDVNPVQGNIPLKITCTDQSSPLSYISSWRWTFGDGTVYETTDPSQRNAEHVYSKSGTYYVTLTVKNRYYQQFSISEKIIARIHGIITGNLWNDKNSNGIQENNENNLTGWQVILEKNQDGRWIPIDSRNTDHLGTYHFTMSNIGEICRIRVLYPVDSHFEITNPDNTQFPNVTRPIPFFDTKISHIQNFGIREITPEQYHEVSLITSRSGHILENSTFRWRQSGSDGTIIINGSAHTVKEGNTGEITFLSPSPFAKMSIAGNLYAQNLSHVLFTLDNALIDSGDCPLIDSPSIATYYSSLQLILDPDRDSDISLIWDGEEIPVSWRDKVIITGLIPMENQKMELEIRPDQVYFIGRAQSYEIT